MRFVWACFDRILELNGEVEFPKSKTVVLYGANLQGKTNLINALRFTFLREIKRGGKKIKYDDWALPTRQEVVPDGKADVDVVFEHGGAYYKLHREISAGGRRDVPTLSLLTGWPGNEVKNLDFEPYVKERLKSSLLDALFAPEIAGGFKRLYGRDIDEAISEVFKEVVSARQISKRFIQRLSKLKSGAEAETAGIREAYRKYCDELLKLSKALSKIPEFRDFQKFQPSKTLEKIIKLLEAIRVRIASLEKDELFLYLQSMLTKCQDLVEIQEAISEEKTMKELLVQMKNASLDIQKLQEMLLAYHKITTIEDEIEKPPEFLNNELTKKTKEIYEKITEGQVLYAEAREGAKKYGVTLETLSNSIRNLGSVITVLSKKSKIGEEKAAAVTKLGEKAYTVIPIELLTSDPTFTSLGEQPIPKGSEKERMRYLKDLKEKQNALLDLLGKEKEATKRFNNFKKNDIVKLSQTEIELQKQVETINKNLNQWINKIVMHLSAFTGISEKTRSVESEEDINNLLDYAKRQVNKKEAEYLKSLNERTHPLDIEVKTFEKSTIKKILTNLEKERLELPSYRDVLKAVEARKEEWIANDEIYLDFQMVPRMVNEAIPILEMIIQEGVDESKLKEAIAKTYNEIIEKMKSRKLIEAIAEMSKDSIQAQVKYKGKVITHPGGAEKAFFSLAILTALGHYFGMPILIDEVANNLDSRNLPAFFNLVIEFMYEMQLQYVLSIKETRDFDLDGWVKNLADDIVVYELKGKKIERRNLI